MLLLNLIFVDDLSSCCNAFVIYNVGNILLCFLNGHFLCLLAPDWTWPFIPSNQMRSVCSQNENTISSTHTEPPLCWRSSAVSPGLDATPSSPASSHSCSAAGAERSDWTQIHPHWCSSGTGLVIRCPKTAGGRGDPRLCKRRPHRTTGPLPESPHPGRRWVMLEGSGRT